MQPLDTGDPSAIGPYRLLGRLGSGGMGRVYLARSVGGRTVAVKVVHPHFATDEEFRARFRREVDAARRVGTGPGGPRWSAPVLDADPEAAVPWVATGYVAGPSLTRTVADHGPLPEHSVRALGAGLAEALTAVHGLGLVHRDVKPSNVLLALDGPRLIDFGIARATDGTASLTSTGVSVGSPGYMSPEQILGGGVTGAADVFSMGAVLTYAATGQGPFPGDSSAALLYKVVHEAPELGAVRGVLRDLVEDCLAKDPSARPVPEEVARRLAPGGGAGALVAAGWLPGPLVEEVSRATVRLLDLETAAPVPQTPAPQEPVPQTPAPQEPVPQTPTPQAPAPTGFAPTGFAPTGAGPAGPAPSGPVPFSNASLGVFGPPTSPSSASPAHPPTQVPAGPAAGRDGRLSFSVSASADASTSTGTGTGTGAGAAVPMGSGGTGTGVDTRRPVRRVSCTVALAVAGALAVAMVSAAFLLDLVPGRGNDDNDNNASTGDSASVSPSRTAASPAASGVAVTEVPETFIGTWSGPTTERSGLPHGTLTAVFSEGATGADVVRTTSRFELLGTTVECYGVGKLVAGSTTDRLRIEERIDPDKRGTEDLCTGGTAELIFTRTSDATLRYQSKEDAAGTPTGTLTKE
jgi:eukaryotic-like serine/threonine-protein kinase